MTNSVHQYTFRILFIDHFLINIIYLFLFYCIKNYNFRYPSVGIYYLLLLLFLNLSWLIVTLIITRYKMETDCKTILVIKKNFFNLLLLTGFVSTFAFIFKEFHYSRLVIYGTLIVFFITQTLIHLFIYYIINFFLKIASANQRTLIVGHYKRCEEIYNALKTNNTYNGNLFVYLESKSLLRSIGDNRFSGDLYHISKIVHQFKVDEMIVTYPPGNASSIEKLSKIADIHGIRVKIVPTFHTFFKNEFRLTMLSKIPVICTTQVPLDDHYNSVYKRLFDLIFSIVVIIVCIPLMLIIALLIKITSKGPILFMQDRVGKKGDVFKIFKFRTMYYDKDKNEDFSTKRGDSRITPIGKILRRYSLDELPQFFNVINNDMSVVGPRPHRLALHQNLQIQVHKYMTRHYIKPGITGWAQVNGWRGPTVTNQQKEQRFKHDIWYINNWSFLLDIKIVLLTIFSKKARKNSY